MAASHNEEDENESKYVLGIKLAADLWVRIPT